MSAFQFQRSRISLAVLMTLCAGAHAQSQETAVAQPLPTVNVYAPADASAGGLPAEYAGGQVARGARLGLLGNVDQMNAPFSSTAYTQALIQDQQARSVADVLQNDPTVRVARGFGNYQELYMIRGFPVNSDDLAYNGLYGLLPRQFVATELLERVERELLTEVLHHTHGNITRAAVILGITRPTLRTKLTHLGLVVEHKSTVTQPST